MIDRPDANPEQAFSPLADGDAVPGRVPLRKRLSYKQARNTVLLTLLLGLVLTTGQVFVGLFQLERRSDELIGQFLKTMQEPAAEAAYTFDRALASRVLNGLFEYRPIRRAEIRDDFGATLAMQERSPAVGRLSWLADLVIEPDRSQAIPLIVARRMQTVGELRVTIDHTVIAEEFYSRASVLVGAGALWTFGLAVILVVMFYLSVTQPFLRLSTAVASVDPDRPADQLLPIPREHVEDELGILVRSINRLLLRLGLTLERHKEAEVALRDSEERLKLAVTATRSGVWDADLRTGTSWWSPEFIDMLGYDPGELAGRIGTWESLIHPDDLPWTMDLVDRYLRGEVSDYEPVYRMKRKDGSWMWIEAKGRCLRDSMGEAYRFTGTMADVTERKRFEEQLMYMATHDPLTGLPNRTLVQDRLSHAMGLCRQKGTRLAILFIDLDRFKLINDSLGHNIGDGLLKVIAKAIVGAVRPTDTVGRLGGDEFLVIAEDLGDPQDAARIAGAVTAAVSRPVTVQERSLFVTPSIGISVYDGSGSSDVPAMLRHADSAMYRAKAGGGNGYRFFVPEMNAEAVARLALENSLREAVETGQFLVYYQPKVDVATLQPVGLEALIRWKHPERGWVSPAAFIPVAEEMGLIGVIGEWVMTQALRQIAEWEGRGIEPLPIAVNISVRQLIDRSVVETVRGILFAEGANPRWLDLEITESIMMDNLDTIVETLRALRELGLRIAVDDFGTGHSSLALLRSLPITALKVDRSFLNDVTTKPDDAAIAATIIAMGQKLGLTVVAEGIERADQLAFLRDHGCHQAQGFLIARPMPADALERRFVRNGRWVAEVEPATV